MLDALQIRKKFLPEIVFFLLPTFVCLLIYYLPPEFKKVITLNAEDLSILSLYTTNFVHYEWNHLTGNLTYYLVFGFVSLFLYNYFGYIKIFRYSLLSILVVVPFLSSIYSLWAIPYYSGESSIYGFSAVVGAVMGLFGYGAVLLITFDEKDYSYSFLFLMCTTLYYFVSTYFGILNVFSLGMLLIALLPFYVVANRHARNRAKRKRITAGFGLIIAYLFFLTSMFPKDLISNGNIVNIPGHLFGLIFGIIVPYLLYIILRGKTSFVSEIVSG
jgi:hypothetical protein